MQISGDDFMGAQGWRSSRGSDVLGGRRKTNSVLYWMDESGMSQGHQTEWRIQPFQLRLL